MSRSIEISPYSPEFDPATNIEKKEKRVGGPYGEQSRLNVPDQGEKARKEILLNIAGQKITERVEEVQREDATLLRRAAGQARWEGERVPIYKVQGRTGEILAREVRPDSVDINDVHANFATYDLADRSNMMSVKTRTLDKDGQTRVHDYEHDLKVALGLTQAKTGKYVGKSGVDIAAEQLLKIRNEDSSMFQRLERRLPPDVATSKTVPEISGAMANKAILLIPIDQVEDTREHIRKQAEQNPQKWGLNSTLMPDQLLQRIQAIHPRITGSQIKEAIY